jgi:hypothetical protein
MNYIHTKHSIKNTSDKYLLVGNCHHVIAAYDSANDANADIDVQVPSIEDSPWGVVQILAPGDSISGDYTKIRPKTRGENAETVALLAMPWSF